MVVCAVVPERVSTITGKNTGKIGKEAGKGPLKVHERLSRIDHR
jgi:hypothetical protein